MASNRGVAYIKPGEVKSSEHRFSQARQSDHRQEDRTRGDPQDHLNQYLRFRPAHGPWPHHRTGGSGSWPRNHRRSDRDGARCRVYQKRRHRFRAVQHRLRPLPKLQRGRTGICLNVNPARPGAAYGYVDMGGWVGGQAEYVMVPYADFNLLKFPDKAQAMEKIKDLTLLSRYLSDRIPRRGYGRSRPRHGGLRRRRGACGIGLRGIMSPPGSGGCHRRRPDPRTVEAGQELRM